MRYQISLLFFTLIFSTCFSQTNYYDEYDKKITKEEFIKRYDENRGVLISHRTETDSTTEVKLLQKITSGYLANESRLKIIKELNELSGKKIDTSDTIIINFYFKSEKESGSTCIDHYTNDVKFKRFVRKNKNISQFFVGQRGYKHKNCLEDENRLIRLYLFKYDFACGNYIIIRPNGQYLLNIGEYKQSIIPDIVNAEW